MLRTPIRFAGLATLAAGLMMAISVLSFDAGPAYAGSYKVPRTHGPTTKTRVQIKTGEAPGTIIISNSAKTLDVVIDRNTVARYRIGIGREGFTWTGTVTIGRKAEWPSWTPPADMRAREPGLPKTVAPGPHNPLGARALYLFRNGRDTLYRIHGTNDAGSVGGFVTAGCFRLTNADVLDLYASTPKGTRVIVRN